MVSFLDACNLQQTDVTPVWFMRQAGRYMPEYRRIRARHTLLEICAQPDLATEITLQPIHALDVDAAILFADILLPLVPMGLELEFVKGEGPHFHNPIQNAADVAALRAVDPVAQLGHILETIVQVKRALPVTKPLIGFAGGPFTLASYIIEGGPSKNFVKTKQMMFAEPELFDALLAKLVMVVSDYVNAQVDAGADAIQIFDSWVGALSPHQYTRYVQHHSRAIFESLSPREIPTIHFGVGTGALLPLMRDTGGDVIGIDWRTPLEEGWQRVGFDRAAQGNLDPVALFAPPHELKKQIEAVLSGAQGRPGHIFNLGHGILPNTPVDNVKATVDMVRELSTKPQAGAAP